MKGKLLITASMALCFAGATVAQQLTVPTMQRVQDARSSAAMQVQGVKLDQNALKMIEASAIKLDKSEVSPKAGGDITVSYKTPAAFYGGFSEDMYYYLPTLLVPSYTELTWTNTSTGIDNWSWTYTTVSADFGYTEEEYVSSDKDLTFDSGFSIYAPPVLTGSDDVASDTYQNPNAYVTSEGKAIALDEEYYVIDNYASMQQLVDCLGWNSCPYYGKGADPDDVWSEVFAEYGLTYKQVEAFGVYFPKPDAPYAISSIYTGLYGTWQAGVELVAQVYTCEIDEDDMPDPSTFNLIAQGSIITNAVTDAVGYYTFNLENVPESDLDLPEEGYVTIDSAIYVCISGYNVEAVTEMYPTYWIDQTVYMAMDDAGNRTWYGGDYVLYDYVVVSDSDDNSYVLSSPYIIGYYTDSSRTTVHYMPIRALNININALFNYLELSTDGQTLATTVDTPIAGGDSESVMYITYPEQEVFDKVGIANDADGDEIIDGADWLSYTIDYGSLTDQIYPTITFTADPLPAGETGRAVTVTLTAPGANPVSIVVGQGEYSGVSNVVAKAKANVAVEGGNFVINAPESIKGVTVYNVAGQAVAAAKVAGTTTIDASSLAKGVYVLRFNDGTTTKVIK